LEDGGGNTKKVRVKATISARTAHDGKAPIFHRAAGSRDATVYVMLNGEVLKDDRRGGRSLRGVSYGDQDGWCAAHVLGDAVALKIRYRKRTKMRLLSGRLRGRLYLSKYRFEVNMHGGSYSAPYSS
jgi:hypothetical protein